MKKGFTIIEMILVLSIIAVIVLLSLPNINEKKKVINNVGCKALVEVVNSQILTYELTGENCLTIDDLVKAGYITEQQKKCPDGKDIVIENGQAVAK